jgi:tartrate dehydrogenase/decarboxylase / D-malate dehydrogenase
VTYTADQEVQPKNGQPCHRIAVIPGDGIGTEVTASALQVISHVADKYNFSCVFDHKPWGCEFFRDTGAMMPEDGLAHLSSADAILLGAVGHPDVADHVSLWGLLIPIRRAFSQYVNLRPIRLFPGISSPLRQVPPSGLDFVVVRENTEGEYSQIGGRFSSGIRDDMAIQESIFTRAGCERIIRYAFDLALKRRKMLTVATKSNGIIHTMPFWDEIAAEVAENYPGVEWRVMHIDALAAKFVLDPGSLDVVVASNLFGDILSDLGAALAGSIGIAPSGNLSPDGTFPSMFEPVHGSAPDIAGRGIANPIGAIWSASMMLDHLGRPEAAQAITEALMAVTAVSSSRTPDIGGTASTADVTTAVLDILSG